MGKIFRSTVKIILITIFSLFIIIVSIPLFFKDQIKSKVLKKIDHNINAKVDFSDISFSSIKSFPHFSLTLKNACVTGVGDFNGDTLVSAKGISVSFDLYRLMNMDNFEIKSIQLEEPIIYARVLKNGKANFDIAKKDSSTGTPKNKFQLSIEKWSINNGRIIYDDKLQKTFIEVAGLNHSGKGDFKQEISDLNITTQVSELTVIYNGVKYLDKKVFKADLLMQMNFKENKFTFKDHIFQVGDFKFGFKGFFKPLKNGYQTDLSFAIKKTSFKYLLSLLPGIYQKDMDGISTKGEFSCEGFVQGTYDAKAGQVPAFHIDLKVDSSSFKYAHLPKAVENINFHFVADNPDGAPDHSSYDLRVFHFEIDKSPFHGTAFLKKENGYYLKADVKFRTDLAEIEKIYPVNGLVLKGILNSEIKIDGNYNDSLKTFPIVDASITLQKGYVKSKDSPLDMDSIHLNAELINHSGQIADTRINLNKITFLLDDEPFEMSGTISDLKDYNYQLKIDGLLDLGKLTEIYPIAGTSLKGTLDFDYITEGSLTKIEAKQFDQLKTNGTLEVKNVSYHNSEIPFPVHVDDALLTVSSDEIILNRFSAEFGKSNVTLSGHLFNYVPYLLKRDAPIHGELSMTCDTLDLNQWFPQSVAAPPPTLSAINVPARPAAVPIIKSNSSSTGTAQVSNATPVKSTSKSTDKEVLVIPQNIRFKIVTSIKKLNFGKMEIDDLAGEIKIKNSVLSLKETGFNTMNSKFNLNGDYITTDPAHPKFDLNIDIAKLDINTAYRMFVDPKGTAPATGNFSTNYNLMGEVTADFSPVTSTLVGSGKIIIEKVSLKGMKLFNHIKKASRKNEFNDPDLNDIAMQTEIKEGKLFIHPFSFKVDRFLTEAEGWQGFDEKMEYLIRLSVPPFSKLRIPISISGTTDNPVIKTGDGFKDTDFEKL